VCLPRHPAAAYLFLVRSMKRGPKFYGDAKWRDSFNKAKEQHAVDQMVFGSTLLRPPQGRAQADFYRCNDVLCTSSGEYFTTLTPVPACLESHVIRTKPFPAVGKKTEAQLDSSIRQAEKKVGLR
jgi:hypothetical protein